MTTTAVVDILLYRKGKRHPIDIVRKPQDLQKWQGSNCMKTSKKKMVQKEQGCPLGNCMFSERVPIQKIGHLVCLWEAGPEHAGVLLFRDARVEEFGSHQISVLMIRCLVSVV